jgi:uncharacterized protein YjiS (DUF1127 family)
MTIINITPHSTTTTSEIQRTLGLFLNRLGRLINHSIAAAIAHRARQADIDILRRLSDRELKDIGLTRGDIGEGLAEAARYRIRMQQIERSRANGVTSNR